MGIIIPIAADPRPVAKAIDRRTYEVRILIEKSGQKIVVASREDWFLDANGVPLGVPVREHFVRRDLTDAFLAANPAVVALMNSISNQIDIWDAEDRAH